MEMRMHAYFEMTYLSELLCRRTLKEIRGSPQVDGKIEDWGGVHGPGERFQHGRASFWRGIYSLTSFDSSEQLFDIFI
jgi:hypothetical protein